MSEELKQPSVVDLDALLSPISEENPSGESLRYSGIYDEINEARRQDDDLNQGEWKTELKVADYRRVIELASDALTKQSKDLQIAVWLSEALVFQHGFVGLRDGLRLLRGFHENFWETVFPEVEEGDMEGRANAVSWFDKNVAFAVKKAPYTGSAGYGFFDWEDSKVFDIPEIIEGLSSDEQQKYTQLRTRAENERRVTAEMWRKEIAATRRLPMEKVNLAIEEAWEAFHSLNALIEEKYDRNQMPGMSGFRKTLEEVHAQVKKLLEEKRVEEPDAIEIEEEEIGAEDGQGPAAAGAKASGAGGGPIQSRKDALKRLSEIADYLHKTEPHSPVSYLINRAVKWGNMPLDSWLQDVIKDDSVMFQLRQTLGFNTSGGDAPPDQQ